MAKATKGTGKAKGAKGSKGTKGTKGSKDSAFMKAASNVSGNGNSLPKTLNSGKGGSKVKAGKGTKQSGKLANGSASGSGKSGTFAKAANNVGKGGKKKSSGSKKQSGKGKEVAGFMKDPTNPEPKVPSKGKGKKGNAGKGGADGNGGAAGKAGKGKGKGKKGGADGNGGAAGKAGKGKSSKGKTSQVTTPQKPVFTNKTNGPMNIPEGAKRGTAKVDTGQMKKKAQEAEKGFMDNVTARKDVKVKGDTAKSMQNTDLDKSVSNKLKNPQESKDQNNPATAGFVR